MLKYILKSRARRYAMDKTMIVNSPEETMDFARTYVANLPDKVIITLAGDLAAGKTTFTKGLAQGIGVTDLVDSPTFTIIKEYTTGHLPLYHIDAYRLDADADIDFLLEYFDKSGICVIEWASNIQNDLPENRIDITICRLDGDRREIQIKNRLEQVNVNVSD